MNPAKGILLVEEYGALAVAITSALQKFAPLHSLAVAHNFAEAETAAEQLNPELLVIDSDPPLGGEVDFFERLRARFPDARVLVLAPGVSSALRTERGTAAAIQFIEKPFDLAELGAAIQALLGPWTAPSSGGVRGTLRHLHAADIVQLKCLSGSSGVLTVETREAATGAIHFYHGQIRHAEAGERTGVPAFEEIIGWPAGRLSESELPESPPQTIDAPWDVLLLQAIRKASQNGSRSAQKTNAPAAPRNGKKILVIDDTEMLLVFVVDVLATANQSFQIITASTGAEGLQLANAVQPDLIVLDYSLGDMTGAQVCQELLKDDATARIPVLMMSGHLTEMASTAEMFGNVVATLAKPFLSGALINEVEKLLENGRLAKQPAGPSTAPQVQSTPTAAPKRTHNGADEEPKPAAPQPQDVGPTPAPAAPSPPILVSPPTVSPVAVPAVAARPETSGGGTPSASNEVSLKLLLEIMSVQLNPFFRIELLKVRPTSNVVSLEMNANTEAKNFALVAVTLRHDRSIDTVRIVPTHQQADAGTGGEASLAVVDLNVEPSNAHHHVQVTAPENGAMAVQLSACFELATVELSSSFEIAGIVLRSRSDTVWAKLPREATTVRFTIQQVKLNEGAHIESLSLRACA